MQKYSSARDQSLHIEDAVRIVANTFRQIYSEGRNLSSPPDDCNVPDANWDDGVNVVLGWEPLTCDVTLFIEVNIFCYSQGVAQTEPVGWQD